MTQAQVTQFRTTFKILTNSTEKLRLQSHCRQINKLACGASMRLYILNIQLFEASTVLQHYCQD